MGQNPAKNDPQENPKTFFPPGVDASSAKKSLKNKKKKLSKKKKNISKATSSRPSDTSEKSDLSISEDSEDAINIDATEIEKQQLSDDYDNEANSYKQSSVDQASDDDIMASQDSEKSTTDEQIQDEDVNPVNIEDVGPDNEYERQGSYFCVQCLTHFLSKEELDKHEISTHSSYFPQEENFCDVSGNENIETDVDKENLSDHSEICRKLFVLVIKKMIIKRVVASLSSDVIMSNIFILNVETDPQNQENAQHDLIEFLYSLKEDIMMDIRNVSYINILENMLIYAENPSVTLPCKIIEDMSLSEIFTVFNSNGINIPPHSLCESVLNRSNEEEEIVSRPSSPLETDGTQKEPCNVQKVDENSPNKSSYSCDRCDSSFSEKANLLNHKKTKHGINQCDICDNCFLKHLI